MSKLSGKVAVVTGASKGIGASIAEHLAAEGASVVVNYASSKSGADSVVARITKKGGKAIAVQGDVSQPNDIHRLFSETKKAYGKLDILVNNAGFYEFAPLEAITPEHIHKQFNLNVTGLLLNARSGQTHRAGGRLDRQYRLHRWSDASAASGHLQCKQSCGRCYYSFALSGAWSTQDSCELA